MNFETAMLIIFMLVLFTAAFFMFAGIMASEKLARCGITSLITLMVLGIIVILGVWLQKPVPVTEEEMPIVQVDGNYIFTEEKQYAVFVKENDEAVRMTFDNDKIAITDADDSEASIIKTVSRKTFLGIYAEKLKAETARLGATTEKPYNGSIFD